MTNYGWYLAHFRLIELSPHESDEAQVPAERKKVMLRAVSKFGGSSVADRECIVRVAALAKAPGCGRNHLVVSAPGKRDSTDIKVTDMLLQAHSAAQTRSREEYDLLMEKIAARFSGLSQGTNPALDKALNALTGDIYDFASTSPSVSASFAASRGEYLNGLVMAHETGFEFVDPADDFLIFNQNLEVELQKSLTAIRHRCGSAGRGGFVIPGFFGGVGGVASAETTATFSRGGSDVTASIVAAALAAEACGAEHGLPSFGSPAPSSPPTHRVVHENFTDVDGVLSADPRLCPGATRLPELSYVQTRALAQAGAAVLHPDAVTPLIPLAVPIHVRSTWQPSGQGTWISEQPARLDFNGMHENDERLSRGVALSVAGKLCPSGSAMVTVVCREVDDETRGQWARRALQARVEAAVDAQGIARHDAAESPSGQSVHVSIAHGMQLNSAISAVFESLGAAAPTAR